MKCWASMRDTDRAERLLSLFTSADRAAAIAGDLTEERPLGGRPLRFWLDVLGTMAALCRGTLADAPLRVVMLAACACALLFATVVVGLMAIFLFPASLGSIESWIVLSGFWWSGALATGALLVCLAPTRGMAVSTVLALAGGAVLLALIAHALWLDVLIGDLLLFYATGLLAAIPLLAGAAVARRLTTVCEVSSVELQR